MVQSKNAAKAYIYETHEGNKLTIDKPLGTVLSFVNSNEVAFPLGAKWVAVNLETSTRRSLAKADNATNATSKTVVSSLPLATTLSSDRNMSLARRPIWGGNALLELATRGELCAEPGNNHFSDAEIVTSLQKFSKPGGFSDAADLGLWLEIINSGRASQGLVAASLLGILVKSQDLFETLWNKAGSQANFSQLDQKSLTGDEKAVIAQHVQAYLLKTFDITHEIHIEVLKRFAPLIVAVSSEKDKDELLAIVGDRAVEDAAILAEFADLPPYQVYAFAFNAAGLLFDSESAVDFTDFVASQTPDKIAFTILGTQPLDETVQNAFGFYSKNIQTLNPGALANPYVLKWDWQQGAKKYEALVSVMSRQPYLNRSPPTSFSTANRHGSVIVDANLEVDQTQTTVAEYVRYFQTAGYKFGDPQAVPDLLETVTKSISSSDHPIDYLVKEAHSNGNSDVVFKVAPKGFVLRGIRKEGGKERETIDIFYNIDETPVEIDVGAAEFGQLIDKRGSSNAHPLVYFNTSCWSYEKASFELGWISSSGFYEIPSLTSVNMFEANDNNAEKVLLDGIRSGSSFKEIRSLLKKQVGYASGFEDRFVFPDEEVYARKIARYGAPPAQISRQLFLWNDKQQKMKYVPDGYE